MSINLSTRELRAFVVLAQQRNFTRAAALCHLSQSAFSALIKGLEEHVGGRLFDRTTRQVELTVEGETFLHAALRLLKDTESAVADVRDHVARKRGRVALAVLPSLAAGWLPPLLAQFHRRYPGIELDLADVLSDVCITRVRSGQADLAIAATRGDAPELRTLPLCTDAFHVVCHRDHPLAQGSGPVKLNELAPYPHIHLARSSSVRQYVDMALYPHTLQTFLELEQLSTVAAMVKENLGVTIVPSLTLFHFADAHLRTRPIRAAGLKRRLFLIHRADRALSSAAQGMLDLLMQHKPGPIPGRPTTQKTAPPRPFGPGRPGGPVP
ncbi:LysR family transcriptional regulator [Tepidicella baoligensis]|uniref:LysR family transcriptional regulator n=1 Tax=Tepidicella baoligensis TaxID=2707016 RepID=UPI0015D9BFB4|nr:LysR family transcriptional regulator [Tepidicella baoligensis]